MILELFISTLGWCAFICSCVLLFWTLFMSIGTDFIVSMQQKFFDLDRTSIIKYNYLLMGFFKLSTLMLFIVPWAVLRFLS